MHARSSCVPVNILRFQKHVAAQDVRQGVRRRFFLEHVDRSQRFCVIMLPDVSAISARSGRAVVSSTRPAPVPAPPGRCHPGPCARGRGSFLAGVLRIQRRSFLEVARGLVHVAVLHVDFAGERQQVRIVADPVQHRLERLQHLRGSPVRNTYSQAGGEPTAGTAQRSAP